MTSTSKSPHPKRAQAKRAKRLEEVLTELTNCVGWTVLNSLSPQEIKDSYSDLVKVYNKAQRLLGTK